MASVIFHLIVNHSGEILLTFRANFFLQNTHSADNRSARMNTRLVFPLSSMMAIMITISSCGNDAKKEEQTKTGTGKTQFVNPFPAGTYEHFTAEPSYPKTYNIYKNRELFASTNATNSRIVLNLDMQRGKLLNGDTVVMDYPISSGRSSHPTPRGRFMVLEKIPDKKSATYGKIYDATGELIHRDADSRTDTVPEGGSFAGAPMKYWMRFTWDGIGHHIGTVPRYPASHGCIRGYYKAMPEVYSKVKVGTPVTIE